MMFYAMYVGTVCMCSTVHMYVFRYHRTLREHYTVYPICLPECPQCWFNTDMSDMIVSLVGAKYRLEMLHYLLITGKILFTLIRSICLSFKAVISCLEHMSNIILSY